MTDNLEYLRTINELSVTIRHLSSGKDIDSKSDKKIIKTLAIALFLSWMIFVSYIFFSNYNAYNYDFSISNTNTNINKNPARNEVK